MFDFNLVKMTAEQVKAGSSLNEALESQRQSVYIYPKNGSNHPPYHTIPLLIAFKRLTGR